MKKIGSTDIVTAKAHKNKRKKGADARKPLVTRSNKRGVKCINCGQPFSYIHACTPAPRQQPSTDIKPLTSIKKNSREKDDTKKPRRTPFDKSVSGTPIRATKLAGATKQNGTHAGAKYKKRFNPRYKKGSL